MAISAVHVANFKGISNNERIEIKPITIFIGANSSGKSSCIHALAALSQTVKLPNSKRHLALDDEFSDVHLGRFIEVIHSKSYSDCISLGVEVPDVNFAVPRHTTKAKHPLTFIRENGAVKAIYNFKCTKRTQDIYLNSATINAGNLKFEIKKENGKYELYTPGEKKTTLRTINRGFILYHEFTGAINPAYWPLQFVQDKLQEELSNIRYLGPFRQPPQRRYPTRGSSPVEVGPQGEATTTLLANEVVQRRSRIHINQIAGWLNRMGLAKSLDVNRVAKSDLFGINFTLKDAGTFPIADLGYGLSQVLPVLTQCSFSPKGSTILFEQPELHIHSMAVRQLASVFLDTIKEKNCHIITETHSRDLVSQFIRYVGDNQISKDNIAIYKVSRDIDHSVLERLTFTNDGEVYTDWDKGLTHD